MKNKSYFHYPHLFAPPSLRTSNLPSSRPSRYLNPILWTCATLGNKEKEQQLRAYLWQTESSFLQLQRQQSPSSPSRTLTPDSVTDYTYDYDNRLIEVSLPTNSDTVEYTYDAMGRRLTKVFTYHNGNNTDVTTYKYHYIGSQITEIEIDAIRNPGEGQSVLRNEEVKIHLGANSQPISYEWVKHVGESTTSATYYYHYDIHGNVLKVTDSSENVKIAYTYDTLGEILTETNPDSILNFFTFRGASQTIWEPETGMYYSGGYYRPDTGTALQGTGAPVLTNPSSSAMLNAVAQATAANAQLAAHAAVSASTAGSDSGGMPGGFSPPSGLSDGLVHAGNQGPAMNTASVEPLETIADAGSGHPLLDAPDCGDYCTNATCQKCKGQQKRNLKGVLPKDTGLEPDGTYIPKIPLKPGDPGYVVPLPCPNVDIKSPELTEEELDLIAEKEGVPTSKDIKRVKDAEEKNKNDVLDSLWKMYGDDCYGTLPRNIWNWFISQNWHQNSQSMERRREELSKKVEWAVFGRDANGKLCLVGYQLKDEEPNLFFSSGAPVKPYSGAGFVGSWSNYNLYSKNFTGKDICLHYVSDVKYERDNYLNITFVSELHTIQLKIKQGYSEDVSLNLKLYTKDNIGSLKNGINGLIPGSVLMLYDGDSRDIILWKNGVPRSVYDKRHSDWSASDRIFDFLWK